MSRMEEANELREYINDEQRKIHEELDMLRSRVDFIVSKAEKLHSLCMEYDDEVDENDSFEASIIERAGKEGDLK